MFLTLVSVKLCRFYGATVQFYMQQCLEKFWRKIHIIAKFNLERIHKFAQLIIFILFAPLTCLDPLQLVCITHEIHCGRNQPFLILNPHIYFVICNVQEGKYQDTIYAEIRKCLRPHFCKVENTYIIELIYTL